jgi:hypothetical protein
VRLSVEAAAESEPIALFVELMKLQDPCFGPRYLVIPRMKVEDEFLHLIPERGKFMLSHHVSKLFVLLDAIQVYAFSDHLLQLRLDRLAVEKDHRKNEDIGVSSAPVFHQRIENPVGRFLERLAVEVVSQK